MSPDFSQQIGLCFLLSNYTLFTVENRATGALLYDTATGYSQRLQLGTSGYNSLNKLWSFVYVTSNIYGLINNQTGFNVDHFNGDYFATTDSYLSSYHQWLITSAGDGYFTISNVATGAYFADYGDDNLLDASSDPRNTSSHWKITSQLFPGGKYGQSCLNIGCNTSLGLYCSPQNICYYQSGYA